MIDNIDYEFYDLSDMKRISIEKPDPENPRIVTAAFRMCLLCGTTISSSGGPGQSLCVPCGDLLRSGQAQGAVVWSDEDPDNG